MAVARNTNHAPKCPKCGKPYKGLYRPQSLEPTNYFFGDTFQGWDISGHVCAPEDLNKQINQPPATVSG